MSVNLLADYFGIKKNLAIPPEVQRKFPDESLCRKCGTCCLGSTYFQGKLAIIPELPCKYLSRVDENTAVCAIYQNRHQIVKWCKRVTKQSVRNGLFPADCPYVRGIDGYRGKTFLNGDQEKKFYRWLKKVFEDQPRPEYLAEEDWHKFREKLGLKA